MALYAGYQISSIDTSYSNLLDREAAAAVNTVGMNRALQIARASIGEVIMSRTDDLTRAAVEDLQAARQDFEKFAELALAAAPGDKELESLRAEGRRLLDLACKGAIDSGRSAHDDAAIAAAQGQFMAECQPGLKQISGQFAAKAKSSLNAAAERSAVC